MLVVALILALSYTNLIFSGDDGEESTEPYTFFVTSPSGEEIFRSSIPSPTQTRTPRSPDNPSAAAATQAIVEDVTLDEFQKPSPRQAFANESVPQRTAKKTYSPRKCCLITTLASVVAAVGVGIYVIVKSPTPTTLRSCYDLDIRQCHDERNFSFNNVCPVYDRNCTYIEEQLMPLCTSQAVIECDRRECKDCLSLEDVKDGIKK